MPLPDAHFGFGFSGVDPRDVVPQMVVKANDVRPPLRGDLSMRNDRVTLLAEKKNRVTDTGFGNR